MESTSDDSTSSGTPRSIYEQTGDSSAANVVGITSDYGLTAFGAPPELDERLFDNRTGDAVQEYAEEDVFDSGGDMGESAYFSQ